MENAVITILFLQVQKWGEKIDIVIFKVLNFQASYFPNGITSYHHLWAQMNLDPAFELSFQIFFFFFLSLLCLPCKGGINVFTKSPTGLSILQA